MESWQEEYQRKFISAEEAAGMVKSGFRVVFPTGRECFAICLALMARKEELKNVEVLIPTPAYDFPWYDTGWEDTFNIQTTRPTLSSIQEAINDNRCELAILGLTPDMTKVEERAPDIFLVEVSAPDERGFCSFGASLWEKKRRVQQSKLVIAEVNERLMRTYGDNFIHISEIDYFVEHVSSGGSPASASLTGRLKKDPEPYMKAIAENVSKLINDGATFQIGVGRVNEVLVELGLLDNKCDLGFHSEATPRGIINLVKAGVINGRRKTVNPGKVVVTSLGGGTSEEMDWASGNPLFWLMDIDYVEDIRVIAAHDNFTAINQCVAVDLGGQVTAESVGTRLVANAGGQIPFVFGTWLSKGGRSITVCPSLVETKNGPTSRIVPLLLQGTVVTLQRNMVDYVVSEYGIARLKGKTLNQRIDELISIAHPDFRAELRKAAKNLFWVKRGGGV